MRRQPRRSIAPNRPLTASRNLVKIMTTILKPETAARIAALADRLGYSGPDAAEQVLKKALDELDARAPRPQRKLTPDEIAAEMEYWAEVGRRNRALHPFDDANPPSKVWQDELYDENGLPK